MSGFNSIKDQNIAVFQNSMKFVESNLMEDVSNSIKEQLTIIDSTPVTKKDGNHDCKIVVSRDSSFDAARKYKGDSVCVLNFASATTPGGGVVKGSSAQEECLCRCSTLYKCLSTDELKKMFYDYHRTSVNALYNDDLIYTPDVVIFKDDKYNMLDPADFKKVDVITCAAPNLREKPSNWYNPGQQTKIEISDEDLLKLHEKRGRKILSVASLRGVDTVILGAFGCGAFRNNPRVVAQAYKNILPEFKTCFKNIEFAVYCRPDDDTNYRVFNEILG